MFNNNIDYKLPVSVLSNGLFATLSLTYEGYLGMEEYQSMKKGDVKIIDGVIVVKVSDIDY